MQPSRFPNDLTGALVGAFCLAMLAFTPLQVDEAPGYPFYKGPTLMPIMALSLGALASLPSFAGLLRSAGSRNDRHPGTGIPVISLSVLLCAALYPPLIIAAGLEAATAAVLAAELLITGERRIPLLLGLPLAMAVLFRLVFRILLDVYFPDPLIASLLPF